MKMKIFLMCVACSAACAQNPIGAIDGVPIPAKALEASRDRALLSLHSRGNPQPSESQISAEMQQQTCRGLTKQVNQAIRDNRLRQFGITVSKAEEDAVKASIPPGPPEAIQRARDEAALFPKALSEVYDQGKDPQQVYANELAPRNISLMAWNAYLEQGKTPEGRANVARMTANALAAAEKGGAVMSNAKSWVEDEKINAAIDGVLSANDPQYAAASRDYKAQFPKGKPENGVQYTLTIPPSEQQYLSQARAQYDRVDASKLNVQLNDPSLKAKCNLAAMGVQ